MISLLKIYLNIIVITISTFISTVFLLTLFSKREKLFQDPKTNKIYSVSIAVPAKNEEKNIAKTIRSLLDIDYPKKPEIIVVNDGSTDKTLEAIKRFPVRIINKKRSEGKSKALNDALKISKGEIFGFIDADTIVSRNVLKNISTNYCICI